MSTERNRVYLQHPTKENALLPAQLLKEDDGLISMRLLEELTLPANNETKQFFHDQHDLFYGFSCQVLRMESSGPNPIVSVKKIGSKKRHESRETVRIPVYDDLVTAKLDDQHGCEVFDVGYNGISVVSTYGEINRNTWVQIELVFDCAVVTGRMKVRYRKRLKDGRYRYGLYIDLDDKHFSRELSNITQALQSLKARRASRITASFTYQTSLSEAEPSIVFKEMEQATKKQKATSPQYKRERRMHDRKAWECPGKVYILEDRRMRVLDINTVDLSQGGLCFVCKPYIYEGTELMFERAVPGGLFRVVSCVQNVSLGLEGLHRVGVKFTEAPLKPGETHKKYYMI